MTRKLILILLLNLLCLGVGCAQSMTVTTFADVVGGNVASIAALNASLGPDEKISLREAIQAANNEPNGSVVNITLPAGNYAISIAGRPTIPALRETWMSLFQPSPARKQSISLVRVLALPSSLVWPEKGFLMFTLQAIQAVSHSA